MATLAVQPSPLAGSEAPAGLARWLLAVAALVFLMIVVGGITRLTESGLSIVRWQPVSGALPPIGEKAWEAAFAAYQATPQYRQVNTGMSLAEFKNIFFWEYIHRLLGRVIGLAFALPLLWFWVRRQVPRGFGGRLLLLLGIGGLQGAIGWWMVASGLVDRPEVSHVRLAIHLLAAMLILAALIWTALDLLALARDPLAPRARLSIAAIWAHALVAVQILFGAYVAGLEAGYAFSSWPKMGADWFPGGTPMLDPPLRNLVDNPIVVQFIHRWFAFVAAAAVLLVALRLRNRGHPMLALALALAVGGQILLGILTLLTGVALPLASAHQAMAAVLVGTLVLAAHRLGRCSADSRS